MRRLFPALLIAAAPVASLAAQNPDFHWDKTLAAGNDVHVNNINGNVKITPSTNGHVVVNGFKHGGRDADRIKAVVEESSRGIAVCVVYDDPDARCSDEGRYHSRDGDHNWNHASVDLEVSVPANVTVFAGSVSGDVSIDGAHGDVTASAVSGDVHLEHLHATSVRANTVSGEIDVRVDELAGRGDFTFPQRERRHPARSAQGFRRRSLVDHGQRGHRQRLPDHARRFEPLEPPPRRRSHRRRGPPPRREHRERRP